MVAERDTLIQQYTNQLQRYCGNCSYTTVSLYTDPFLSQVLIWSRTIDLLQSSLFLNGSCALIASLVTCLNCSFLWAKTELEEVSNGDNKNPFQIPSPVAWLKLCPCAPLQSAVIRITAVRKNIIPKCGIVVNPEINPKFVSSVIRDSPAAWSSQHVIWWERSLSN